MTIEKIYQQLAYHHLDDDTNQDLAIKIWERLDQFSGDSFGAWVSTIVKNHLIDKSRRRKEKEINLTNPLSSFEQEGKDGVIYSSIDAYLVADEPSPLDDMIVSEQKEELLNRINELDDIYSDVLVDYINGNYDSSCKLQRNRLHRAKEAIITRRKKEMYLLINLRNQDKYKVGTLKQAAEITGMTTEGIRFALNNSGLFLKKSWQISRF
jgi:RNA polymerase sigma factor (sigma-70 family)